eukprot:CAMPEP_0197023492 /NCGR_PEP_ID=MMETSP1384-20130603/4170_1 /TAXON_ID=29189 /ORGANISM="Ammonia sp." /LENGTH=1252 /DNA_ID=CAMNT_0042451707 /DNA_START=35 /DNA_END=3793 /DNA_ORIENTATION=+
MQSSKPLQLRHVFGFRADVSNPFSFVDEHNVIFSAGHSVIVHNIEDKTQTFFGGQPLSSGTTVCNVITAIDVYTPKKIVAVAEKTEKSAVIQLLELSASVDRDKKERRKRRKMIHCSDIQSREIIALKFSHDGKFLLAMGGAPDWCVMTYQREKGRVVQILRNQTISSMPFYSGSYCPSDNNLIVCTGHKVLKFYKAEQVELRRTISPVAIAMGKRDPQDYSAHCWDQDKRLLVATEHGEILMFDGTEFRGAFDTQFSQPIFCIVSYSRGFVCGGDNGTLLAFERGDDDDKDAYKKVNQLSMVNEHHSITHLAVAPSEEQLACIVASNQIYTVNLSQIEILKQQDCDEDEDDDDEWLDEKGVAAENDANFQLLLTAFHCKGINGLDLCMRKPYVVSCGDDRSVKIWNWHEKKMIMSKVFAEDPLCVAVHPNGLHIVVAFADKLRMMNILMDDIRAYKDFSIKGCTEVKFSNGGQYFAAINASAVQIYETYTYHNIATLRGHTAKVTSIWWYFDDSQLVTASTDNSVLVWNIHHNSRTQEHQHKGCSYSSACLDRNKLLYASGNDETLKVIADGEVRNIIDLPVGISSLELSKSPQNTLLFSCTNTGMLLVFNTASIARSPDDEEVIDSTKQQQTDEAIKYVEMQAHTQAITRLRVSSDDSMLVTASADGSVCIFDIMSEDELEPQAANIADQQIEEKQKKKKSELQQLSWAEEILVSRSDLEQRLAEIEKLRKHVDDLRLHNEHEIRMKEVNYQQKLREVNERFEEELDQDRNKFNALRTERDNMQNKYEDTLSSLTLKHEENLVEVEHYHQQKMKSEKQRYNDLQMRLDTLQKEWKEDKQRKQALYDRELSALQQEYEMKIAEQKEKIAEISAKIQKLTREFEEIKVLLEQDADKEIADLKAKYDEILKTERTQTLELRGNNGMLKREFAGLQQRIKSGNDKMEKSMQEQNKLIEEMRRLEKDIDGYEREINERDSTIKEKKKMIQEVEKKNQELEKFKFVLDYKIHELDRQIKPREAKIEQIDTQICEMKSEVDAYVLNNRLLALKVKDLKLKLKGLQNEQSAHSQMNQSIVNLIKVIVHELSVLNQEAQCNNTEKLKQGIIDLHKQFADVDLSHPLANDADGGNQEEQENRPEQAEEQASNLSVHEEFQRRREYMERTVQGLQKKLVKDAAVAKKDSTRIMQENVALIKEINELRREIVLAKQLQNQSKSDKSVTNSLKRSIRENQQQINQLSKLKQHLQSDHNDQQPM